MKLAKSKKMWILGIIAILLLIPVLLFIVFFGNRPNYAEEAAKPIEQALYDKGAKKIKGGGDGGYGPDNQTPGYGALLSVPMSEAETTTLVKSIAAENGYSLKEATKEDKGPINIDDRYLGGIYYDWTSRKPEVSALRNGYIKFSVDINKENADTDPNKTTVQLGFELPSFK